MQSLALEAAQGVNQLIAGALGEFKAATISAVAHQGESHMSHMDADLVGATGFEIDADMGVGGIALHNAIMGDRFLATVHHRHAGALARMATDGRIDGGTGHQYALHYRLVFPAHTAILQLGHQGILRTLGTGNHHQPGGVLVEAVNDAAAWQQRLIRVAMQQGIEQCALGISRARVNHQPYRLVDDQDVLILINQVEGDILRYPVALLLQFGLQVEAFTAKHLVAAPAGLTIESNGTILDPLLKPGTGKIRKQRGGHLIESLADTMVGHGGVKAYLRVCHV